MVNLLNEIFYSSVIPVFIIERKFAEYVKAVGPANAESTLSGKAFRLISQLFHLDNQLDGLPDEERLKQRQLMLKPKVDAFFEWIRSSLPQVPGDSTIAHAFRYCLNQESYLRVFLSDPHVPMDNNRAEQAIRPFTLGRKNWVNMYSIRGAQSSAILYSRLSVYSSLVMKQTLFRS